ncbi:hypothetical protein CW354_15215 [Marinicaulis flavus]|uniref:Uncharacterized protein n=1 Tax=Hyphococcus luteus TaxID=2058213 RepID=A0A2S7K2W1_9PROT|nr:hypothetical protein CW354_15215 [Marinicaulis flavus]
MKWFSTRKAFWGGDFAFAPFFSLAYDRYFRIGERSYEIKIILRCNNHFRCCCIRLRNPA